MSLTIFDFGTGDNRPATQEDVDLLQKIVFSMSKANAPLPVLDGAVRDFSFKLAIYPNPMRPDGVFVSEEKPIEPYGGLRGLDGKLLYPSTPATENKIMCQIEPRFAAEIVLRWNL